MTKSRIIEFKGQFISMYEFLEAWNLVVHDYEGSGFRGRGIRHLIGGVTATIGTGKVVTKLKIPLKRDAGYPMESAFIEDVAYYLRYGPVTIRARAYNTWKARNEDENF